MIRLFGALLGALFLQGCAHLTTYQASLGSPDTGVSMDAKQRVVLVNQVSEVDKAGRVYLQRRMCAEPSPDALAALSASVGGSWLSGTGSSAQLAAALGESTASIGLRTTSIQLMRDSMYRLCEGYLSGAMDKEEYADRQAHSQSLVVGLLAIEQLTGAVRASQVAITSNSGAGGATDAVAEADQLKQAKKELAEQQATRDQAAKEVERLAAEAKTKQTALDAEKKKSDPKKEDLDRLQGEFDASKKSLDDAVTDLKKQTALLEVEESSTKIAQQAFDLARTRVRATTSGDAKFSEQRVGGLSDLATTQVATTVELIADRIITTGPVFQKCISVLARPDFEKLPRAQTEMLLKMCDTALRRIEKDQIQTGAKQDFLLRSLPSPMGLPLTR